MNEVILLFEILCRSIKHWEKSFICLHHDTKKVEKKPRAYKPFTDKEKNIDLIKSRACKNSIEKREDIKF